MGPSPTASPDGAVVPEHWAAALARGRDVVNPAVAALTAEGVPTTAVTTALRSVGPAFETHCARLPPAAQDAWAAALALAVLQALAARQWSPRTVVPWTVTELLPRLATQVHDPGPLVPDLVHAATQVWRCGDAGLWGRLLIASVSPGSGGAGPLSPEAIRDAGVVAAWRAGHVRLRDAAHRVGATLPPAVLARAVDLVDPTLATDAMAANAEDPVSWLPDERPSASGDVALRTIGGFAGFGGAFHSPPVVEPVAPPGGDGVHWRLRDGATPWELTADVHGHWLVRATDPSDGGGGSRGAGRPRPAGGRSRPGRTASGRAVLLTSPDSHVVVHARASS